MKSPNLAMALRAAYLTMHRQTNTCLKKIGITADQFTCIAILMENEGITQKEVAKYAFSDPNTISAMILLLEKLEIIIRRKNANDGRENLIYLTQKGKRIFKEAYIEIKPVRQKMLRLFETTERKEIINSLIKISEALVNNY